MLKTLTAATAAIALMSGIALAQDVGSTETTRQSTGIGPLKFETDKTVHSDSSATMAPAGAVEVDKSKTVRKDWDGDTSTRTKTESETVR